MIVTLEEMKQYLRVDYEDDDALIEGLIHSSETICMDIIRTDDMTVLSKVENAKTAVMYTTAYLYEHREEADHHELMMTLRALLFGSRLGGF
ncbi:MAG: head-tail connector protein [Hespellia sp.]|nr:head-tail connector protein [Hespellia sp.]